MEHWGPIFFLQFPLLESWSRKPGRKPFWDPGHWFYHLTDFSRTGHKIKVIEMNYLFLRWKRKQLLSAGSEDQLFGLSHNASSSL